MCGFSRNVSSHMCREVSAATCTLCQQPTSSTYSCLHHAQSTLCMHAHCTWFSLLACMASVLYRHVEYAHYNVLSAAVYHLTNSVMASLARSVPLACACFAALEAASLTAAGAGCQSGGPCTQRQSALGSSSMWPTSHNMRLEDRFQMDHQPGYLRS